jgi:hypothetical protein
MEVSSGGGGVPNTMERMGLSFCSWTAVVCWKTSRQTHGVSSLQKPQSKGGNALDSDLRLEKAAKASGWGSNATEEKRVSEDEFESGDETIDCGDDMYEWAKWGSWVSCRS